MHQVEVVEKFKSEVVAVPSLTPHQPSEGGQIVCSNPLITKPYTLSPKALAQSQVRGGGEVQIGAGRGP